MNYAQKVAREVARRLLPTLQNIDARLEGVEKSNNRLENRMTSMEDQAWGQLGALIGVVVAEVASLKDGIAQKDAALQAAQTALAGADAAAEQKVADALAADSAADVDRVNSYLGQLSSAAPVDVPEVPVPDPGTPADPPADSGVTVPDAPVDGGDTSGDSSGSTNPDDQF